jgi:hypothetical protein
MENNMDDDDAEYMMDVLKEKCNSFKVENGRLVKYQISKQQWKSNRWTRAAIKKIVANHKAIKRPDDSNAV